MSKIDPAIPKGTRDFGPQEVAKRNYIIHVIRKIFEKYGFKPIETPAMENRQTLTGKYGEEADRLIFNILNSGDYMSKANGASESKALTPLISEKALRYDLTVPFARYVVQHRNDITFPFKRYQIQPVWRADRPQKGRYREFWQCDADIIGSDSLLNEVELLQIMSEVFNKLDLKAKILINHRKVLLGIAESLGKADKFNELTKALDKYDRGWPESVVPELEKAGFTGKEIDTISQIVNSPNYGDIRESIKSEDGIVGFDEITNIIDNCKRVGVKGFIAVPYLARGLDYYTGAIFEALASDGDVSIAGGGRYDNLTEIFGLKDVSGVGFSFGLDRIYNVLEDQGLFPDDIDTFSKVLVVNFGNDKDTLNILKQIREAGIPAELYPDAAKLAKQMKYADANQIPYVLLAGEEEMKTGQLTLKDMDSGDQKQLELSQIITELS